VGSRATAVTVTVKVACQSEVFDQHTTRRLAAISFTQEVSAAPGANYALVSQITTTLVGMTVTGTKRGTLALSIQAEGVWVYQWSLSGSERATLPADPSQIIITVGGE
jgi:hypothetical protein